MAKLNSLLTLLGLGTGHILKALLILILIVAPRLQLIIVQVWLNGLELSGLGHQLGYYIKAV